MLSSVRQEIAKVNADQQAYSQVNNLETWITREPEIAVSRLISILFAAFSGLALALAGVGLYSVVSYSVVQRTGEFGIRIALGAQRADVLRIVAWSASASVGIGLAAGLALSFGLGRVIAQWVHNSTHDPLIALGVSLLVIVVAGFACLVPALRALAVDPIAALRSEWKTGERSACSSAWRAWPLASAQPGQGTYSTGRAASISWVKTCNGLISPTNR